MNALPQLLSRRVLVLTLTGIIGFQLAGCVSTTFHTPLGTPTAYEEVALIDTSSLNSICLTEQSHQDKAIQRLKEKAARLGANGVILQTATRPTMGHIGHTGHTTAGSSTASHPTGGPIVVPSSAGIGIGSDRGHGHIVPGATTTVARSGSSFSAAKLKAPVRTSGLPASAKPERRITTPPNPNSPQRITPHILDLLSRLMPNAAKVAPASDPSTGLANNDNAPITARSTTPLPPRSERSVEQLGCDP